MAKRASLQRAQSVINTDPEGSARLRAVGKPLNLPRADRVRPEHLRSSESRHGLYPVYKNTRPRPGIRTSRRTVSGMNG